MQFAGLQKMTLLDFPGLIACTVFLPSCNLRCPFCHNASLVLPERKKDVITQEDLLGFLTSRKGKLDGVCITGGEPTLYQELPEFLSKVKALGFQIKLDTNGTNPQMLRHIIEHDLCDYVATDIKNCPEKYALTCGGKDVLEQVKESAKFLMDGTKEYEFRTTAMHPYHEQEDFAAIGRWLKGAKRYFIQNFVDSGDLLSSGMEPLTEDEMKACQMAVQQYIPNTQLRGM